MNFDKRCGEMWTIFTLSAILPYVLSVFEIIESYFNSVFYHTSAYLIIRAVIQLVLKSLKMLLHCPNWHSLLSSLHLCHHVNAWFRHMAEMMVAAHIERVHVDNLWTVGVRLVKFGGWKIMFYSAHVLCKQFFVLKTEICLLLLRGTSRVYPMSVPVMGTSMFCTKSCKRLLILSSFNPAYAFVSSSYIVHI
jgi:hypothetical protein